MASSSLESFWRRYELPTWTIALSVYSGWLAVTWSYRFLPAWLVLPLGGWLLAWHGSLQHEAVHGHPTRSARINALVAGAPLALWMPFPLYRETHLAHHRVEQLTDPSKDPESYYTSGDAWRRMGPLGRAAHWVLATLAGRLVIGPAWIAIRTWRQEIARMRAGDRRRVLVWVRHVAMCAVVLAWVIGICRIPLAAYVALFVYPGLSLTLLRSFAEHRAGGAVAARSALVEAGPLFSLLFLNNNLHAVHHQSPRLPWFEIPGRYRARRAALLRESGGFWFRGYTDVARRYALRPKDAPAHPEA